jgi:hypothetical protein
MTLKAYGLSGVTLAALLLTACGVRSDAVPRLDSTAVAVATVSTRIAGSPSPARVPDAERRLAMFLEGSQSGSSSGPDSLWSCHPDGMTDRYLTLATSRVLDSSQQGDTVIARAEVTTVASEVGDPKVAYRYVTTVRTRTDTMEWKMTRDSTGKWGVCDYPLQRVGFGNYGNDAHTTWKPAGYTWSRVERIADSIRARP